MTITESRRISRRQFVSTVTVVAAGAWTRRVEMLAQHGRPARTADTQRRSNRDDRSTDGARCQRSHRLRRNIAVLPGRDGKLLVDAGIPGSRQRIVEALAAISGDSITRLVNTHRHFDHTDGNEWLHAAGAAILAHENARNHLSTTTRVGRLELHVPTFPRGRAPNGGLQDAAHSASQRHAVVLEHYEPAHTDSDVSVHFTDLDVIHLGDTWWNGVYPFIDYSTGGSIDGTIRAGLMHTLRER